MKCLRIAASDYVRVAIDSYLNQLDLTTLNYSQILAKLRSQYFLSPGSFISSMNHFGWDCEEFFIDHEFLARIWCRDRNLPYTSCYETLNMLISEYKPEILYIERNGLMFVSPEMRRDLKNRFPFLQKIVGYWGAQLGDDRRAGVFLELDHLFCLDAHLQLQMQCECESVTVVPPAFDPIDCEVPKENDFVFIGSTGYASRSKYGRYRDLTYLLENTPIKLWVDEEQGMFYRARARLTALSLFGNLHSSILKPLISNPFFRDAALYKSGEITFPDYFKVGNGPLRKKYPDKAFPSLFGLDYFRKIASSRLVFNRHVDDQGHGGNMRCFEVTGVGSCLLTDRAKQLSHLFVPDEEIVCYDSIEEAAEKSRYLLENPRKMESIAKKGKERTHKEHLMIHRVEKMLCIIQA